MNSEMLYDIVIIIVLAFAGNWIRGKTATGEDKGNIIPALFILIVMLLVYRLVMLAMNVFQQYFSIKLF